MVKASDKLMNHEIDDADHMLHSSMSYEMYQRLMRIRNHDLRKFITWIIDLCKPSSIFISTGSPEDLEYIRRRAIETGEEIPVVGGLIFGVGIQILECLSLDLLIGTMA
jgi:hypothetical protein